MKDLGVEMIRVRAIFPAVPRLNERRSADEQRGCFVCSGKFCV